MLWPRLIAEWQLNRLERDYIDQQQGTACTACGANLRLIALGNALRGAVETGQPLRNAVADGLFDDYRILDCNGAGAVSTELLAIRSYCRVDYPECDMQRLPFSDKSFDIILHSDTLEHVEYPLLALEECRRVFLTSSGRLCFTVPIIVDRLSRNRAGLAPSYHGAPSTDADDLRVHTEFGADAWTIAHRAGFLHVTLSQVRYHCAIAITAWTDAPRLRASSLTRPSPIGAVEPNLVPASQTQRRRSIRRSTIKIAYDRFTITSS